MKRESRKTLPTRWTKTLNKLFLKLAVKEATGDITPLEMAQIEYLSVLRRTK